MKNIKTFNDFGRLNESEKYKNPWTRDEEIKPMNWREYCDDVFNASAKEVESALIAAAFDTDEIKAFKKAKYYRIGGVTDPDMNKSSAKLLMKNADKLKPQGTFLLDLEEYYDKDGTLRLVAIACSDRYGLAPMGLDYE